MELNNRVVVLTGASRGIGRALAHEFARAGCTLLLTALEEDELSSLEEELEGKYSVPVASMAANLTDKASREALIEWIRNREESLDVLVNNAGAGFFGRFELSEWESIEMTLALNIHGCTHLSHALIPRLKERPRAMIVNISSAIAWLPYPGLAVYGAAKGYLSSLSASLASELSDTSVGVLCFHPGMTMTHFFGSARMDMSRVPKRLITTPEKAAARIIRAIEDDRQWVYGDTITRFGVILGSLLPAGLKTKIFKNFFWRLPDED